MAIHCLEQQNKWVLRAGRSDYVIQVSSNGQVLHHYWGAKQRMMDYEGPHSGQKWYGTSHTDSAKEEIMPWGGLKYTEPGLKITGSDHVRDLQLHYHSCKMTSDNHLTITLEDSLQQIRVRLHYKVIEPYDLIERYTEIDNVGNGNVTLEQVMGAVWHLPVYPQYNMTYLTGHWGAEFQLRREPLQEGKKVLESRCGLSGHLYNPWFAIDFGDATEEHGEVYYGAIAYSGNWKLVAEKTMRQSLQVAAGLNDFDFAWTLKPGDTFASPVCIGGFTNRGFGQASRDMHEYQRKHVLPNGDRIRPVMYNSWYATHFDVNEESQQRLADQAAALGAEVFVMDDGWFGNLVNKRSKLGDWTADPGKFPNGLQPLIEYVKSRGMLFGIWVEPENVNPDSELFRAHQDWLYRFPGREMSHLNNEFTLNLAKEEVREYIVGFMDELLSKHDITYIKWDMNRYVSEPGWAEAGAEQHKEVWARHVEGLYGILAELREKHPHVWFEACASGGGRADLGIMKYSEQIWISDDTDGFDRLFIQEGYSYAYSPNTMMCWVAPPARFRPRFTSLRYRFHSAMMGSLGIGLDLNKLSEEEKAECAAYVKQYKEIRSTVQEGQLYRLVSPRSPHGTAVQYVNRDQTQAVLFAFRHSQQYVHPVYPIRMKGLHPEGLYHCEQLNMTCSGASLMAVGVQPDLKGDFDSELLVFRKNE